MDIELNLTSETVEHAGMKPPLVVAPNASLREVFDTLKERKAGGLLVCEQDRLVGMFTERDALRLMATKADLDRPVSEVMTRNPGTLPAGSSVADAIKTMSQGGYRTLPIVDEQGIPQGVVSVKGLIHYLVEHFPQSVYNLPPQPMAAMEQREGA